MVGLGGQLVVDRKEEIISDIGWFAFKLGKGLDNK
jgi:hypothetical protein